MRTASAVVLSLVVSYTTAQQPGELTPEAHPSLSSKRCTLAGGCVSVNSSIVLDSNYRWLHNVGGYTNCVGSSGFDPEICPDIETCAANCTLEGVDYATYGISTSGDALTLDLFVQKDNTTSLASPRVYLLENDDTYVSFNLLNAEFTFDVDVSNVPCGINGALYFSEMDATGNKNALNAAGAAYGTGYCDAQCPTQNFIKGEANLNSTFGACCSEMDIWEANAAATAYTPHPCNTTGVYACSGTACGDGDARYAGVCDKDGCDYNPYRQNATSFYGANLTINTSRPFTVVTQFPTHNGVLTEIRRLYVQDGRVIHNARSRVAGMGPFSAVSDEYCREQKEVFGAEDAFAERGGLGAMGEALGRGMVLAMSVWDDSGSGMLWLDGTPADAVEGAPGAKRGPCGRDSGDVGALMEEFPEARVVFSDIRSGEIGSTFRGRRVG
ncbi:cellobiohydrolaseI [Lophium mytilinum]|uniref:Glucanase n=1 Tax=Lophium mytilinum TaxID=390894 RepID=A0A6A6QRH6_9PEZI|nr:cellobiohydrolaseI [Lophium mytilinum]